MFAKPVVTNFNQIVEKLSQSERDTPAVEKYCKRLERNFQKIAPFIPRNEPLKVYVEAMLRVNSPNAQGYHDKLWGMREAALGAFSIGSDAQQAFKELHLLVVRNSKTPELLSDRLYWTGSLDEGLKSYSGQQRGCLGLSKTSPFLPSMPFTLVPLGYKHPSEKGNSNTSHYHERTFELSIPLVSVGQSNIISAADEKLVRQIDREAGKLIIIPPGHRHQVIRPQSVEPLSHPATLVVALPGAAYDRIGNDRTEAELAPLTDPVYRIKELICGSTRVNLFHQEGEGGVLLGFTELQKGQTFIIDSLPFRQEGSVSGIFIFSDGETVTRVEGGTAEHIQGNSLALLNGVPMSVKNRFDEPAKIAVVSSLGHRDSFPEEESIQAQFIVD